MTRAVTPKLGRYLGLAALLVFAGLLFGRVEFVVLACPLVVAGIAGLGGSRPPSLEATTEVDMDRCLEGDVVVATVSLRSETDLPDVEVAIQVPYGFDDAEGSARRVVSLEAATSRVIEFPLVASHWGTHHIGIVAVRVMGPARVAVWEDVFDHRRAIKVFPSLERIRRGLRPPDTQVYSGNYVARSAGDGIEFSHVRPFEPGAAYAV